PLLAGAPPLTRELRSLAAQALETGRGGQGLAPEGRQGAARPPAHPWKEKNLPRFHTAIHGLGGLALMPADLEAFCHEAHGGGRGLVYLGIDFLPDQTRYPKREVLLEQIRRAYPEVKELGLRVASRTADSGAGDAPRMDASAPAMTIAIRRPAGSNDETLVEDAALLLQAAGRSIRGQLDQVWERFGEIATDRLSIGEAEPDAEATDVVVWAVDRAPGNSRESVNLRRNGAVLLPLAGGASAAEFLPAAWRKELQARDASLFTIRLDHDGRGPDFDPARERILGALMGLLSQRDDTLKPRRLAAARKDALADADEPQRSERLNAFQSGLDDVRREEIPAAPEAPSAVDESWEAPLAVRHLGRTDLRLDNVSRFWDETGVLYHSDDLEELSPDPYLSTGAVPPLSATFRDHTPARDMLPHFDPLPCTGCGRCWTVCPDAAIGPVAQGAEKLIESGMAQAKAHGHQPDALRAVAAKLAARAHREMRSDDPPATLGGALEPAFAWLIDKMAPAEDRRRELETAFGAVRDEIGALPVARTRPFLDEPEGKQSGSGELLSIAIDPGACKGCGACVAVCESQALTRRKQTPDLVEAAREAWRRWETLPDNSGATIARVAEHPEVGRAAAVMLSRHCRYALASGDGAEAGSGEKTALRLVLAAVEYHLQPLLNEQVKSLREEQESLGGKIRDTLAGGLPTDDLEVLAQGLKALGRQDVDLGSLAGKLEEACETEKVDGRALARLVDAARGLADLRWRLETGPSGMGRARASLAVSGTALNAWAGHFPNNPFPLPVVLDGSGEAAALAQGLLEGQMRELLDGFRLIRRGLLEQVNPAQAERETASLAHLGWRDLTPEERRLCPPLILAGDETSLQGEGLAQLSQILASDLPVKVVVLSDLMLGIPPGAAHEPAPAGAPADLALLALAHGHAFVAQGSPAYPDRLADDILAALRHPGPALIHIHAPKPLAHGFAADGAAERARLAVLSRTLPLLRFDPAAEGVFGLKIDVTANPDHDADWVEDGGPLTPAHWAAGEARFAGHFHPLKDDAPSPTPLTELLRMPREQWPGKTPFITRDGSDERLRVSSAMASYAAERLRAWRTLQELAGVTTPFTERVRKEAEESLKAEHEAELQSVREDYEKRIAGLRREIQQELAQRLQQRLVTLAGRGRPGDGQD
ncbi:MAG: hypothetical protein GF355_05285, partial [Candidatus Eisenbacteria bacterium]|nr:hypothetical protein [Candidatus Eisenbacteria bacterium]